MNKFRTNGTDYWHCTYIITNECGLFYIGLHSFPKSKWPDPWKYNGPYYGSGSDLKKAREKIKHGWNPIQITSVWKSRRAAQNQETTDIHSVKALTPEYRLCLNYWFRWDEWKDYVMKHLKDTYSHLVPPELHEEAKIHFMYWLQDYLSIQKDTPVVEDMHYVIRALFQQARAEGRSWAYAKGEKISAKVVLARKSK